MAQVFNELRRDNVRGAIYEDVEQKFDTLRSNFSGDSFPENPFVGQFCFRTDESKMYHWNGEEWKEVGSGGGSGLNVGDIFYTSRLDTELNGAVEANGGVYAVADFTGAQSVPELLRKGSLPFVSMTEYESILSANGSCRAWGWDNDTFRVPTAEKQKRVLVAKKEATTGDSSWYNWYSDGWLEQGGLNARGVITLLKTYKNTDYTVYATSTNHTGQTGQDSDSGIIINDKTVSNFNAKIGRQYSGDSFVGWEAKGYAEVPTEAEYQFQNIETHRAMVQIATGATDEALATCTGVLADVADLKDASNFTTTGKETIVGWGAPDYSAGVTVTDGFVCPCDGVWRQTSRFLRQFVNGVQLGDAGIADSASSVTNMLPVFKGDVLTSTGTQAATLYTNIFYPYKGVK